MWLTLKVSCLYKKGKPSTKLPPPVGHSQHEPPGQHDDDGDGFAHRTPMDAYVPLPLVFVFVPAMTDKPDARFANALTVTAGKLGIR